MCTFEGCTKRIFSNGLCVSHGAQIPRCKIKDCLKGRIRKGLCKKHGAYPCENCSVGNATALDPDRKLCYSCYCIQNNIIPTNLKLKEAYFNDLMSEHFPDVKFQYNKMQPTECKVRRFPDWSYDFVTHLLIIELDEHQHESYKCEVNRENDIVVNAACRPVIFLRINPDQYESKTGTMVSPCFRVKRERATLKQRLIVRKAELTRTGRWKVLKERIAFYMDNPENIPPQGKSLKSSFMIVGTKIHKSKISS